jgi:DNA-binding MarR family transcriptional regulator
MSDGGGSGSGAGGTMANLWRLIQAVVDDSEAELETLGLSAKAFFLLQEIGEHPFPAQLARRMHLPPPTVTYLVKQLEERGFVARRAEPGDLRKFRLARTEAGQEALGRGREALGAALGKRLGRLGRQEVAAFDRLVERLAGGEGEA